MSEPTEHPKQLRSAKDYMEWGEWIMLNGANGSLPGPQITGLQKTLMGQYKIMVEGPLKMAQILSRVGDKGFAFKIPWLEQVMETKRLEGGAAQ